MNELTRQVIEQLKSYEEFIDNTPLQKYYEAVLDSYLTGNYPQGYEGSTLMCSIHDAYIDEEGHNCLGCNLEEQSNLLIRFLTGFASFTDYHSVAIHFHMLLYLLAERYNQYIDIMKIPDESKHRHFRVFQQVIQWANFIKHPKAFGLVHHP